MFLPANITLQFGDTGDFVAELQRRLSLLKLLNETSINGTFDGNTVNAVKSFQSMQGIRMDGIAGPETLRRLNGAVTGDSSSSSSDDSAQEEEEKRRAGNITSDMLYGTMPDTQPIDPTLTAAPAAPEEKPKEAAAEKPAVAAVRQDQQAQSQEAQQQAARQTGNLLNDMLMQAAATAAPPPPPVEKPIQQDTQQQLDAIKQQELAAKQQEAHKPNPAEALKQQQDLQQKPKEEAAPERKPLSAMLQKLVDYIESKLPKSVVNEVKEIGQNMLKAGVREAAMPSDTPRAPELEAARGAAQQQQQRS